MRNIDRRLISQAFSSWTAAGLERCWAPRHELRKGEWALSLFSTTRGPWPSKRDGVCLILNTSAVAVWPSWAGKELPFLTWLLQKLWVEMDLPYQPTRCLGNSQALPLSRVFNQPNCSCCWVDVKYKCCQNGSIRFCTCVLSVIIFPFIFIRYLHILLHMHVKVNLYHVIA